MPRDPRNDTSGERHLQALLMELESEDWHVRLRASEAVQASANPAAVPCLIRCLADPDLAVRRSVVAALSHLARVDDVSALCDCLESRSDAERAGAQEVLKRLGPSLPRAALFAQLQHRSLEVKNTVLSVLATSGPETYRMLASDLSADSPRVRADAVEALIHVGAPAVPSLMGVLGAPQAVTRRSVLRVLLSVKEFGSLAAAVAEEVASRLGDSDPAVRELAGKLLRQLGTAALPAVAAQVHDDERGPWARRLAVEVLCDLDTGETAYVLVPLIMDLDREVAGLTEAALARGGASSVPRLLEAAQGNHRLLQTKCVKLLAAIGDPSAIPVLSTLVRSGPGKLALAAAAALRNCGSEAVPCLLECISLPSVEVRAAVVEAVGDLRDERALAGLCGALQDRAATVRKAALSALRRLGHPGSVGSLVERLDDKNAGIRRAAAGALRELGWSAATPDAAARLAFAQQDWYALRKMGPDALPVLHDNLGDAELSVRMESVRILGRMGYATSLPALRDRLRRWGGGERDPDVRERIREATIAIERVVRHTRQLPIPGEPAAATTDQLPIPAASEPKVPGADPPLGR